MESRMEKYYREDNPNMQRSSKNVNLYREVYQDYNSLDNLPIPDNTNEIDIPELKKIMHNNDEMDLAKTREMKFVNLEKDILEKNDKEEPPIKKIHDINKLLEYAKNENNKLKEQSSNHENTSNYKLLQTLENKVLTKEDLMVNVNKSTPNNIVKSEDGFSNNEEENIELKYQTKKISVNPSIDQIITNDSTSSLSLDILSDLKPNGDTGVTKPVKNNQKDKTPLDDNVNIIKDDLIEDDDENDNSPFYTDTYKFSKKDFDDDFFDNKSKGNYVFKIILLILFIILCVIAILYFISNYGFN